MSIILFPRWFKNSVSQRLSVVLRILFIAPSFNPSARVLMAFPHQIEWKHEIIRHKIPISKKYWFKISVESRMPNDSEYRFFANPCTVTNPSVETFNVISPTRVIPSVNINPFSGQIYVYVCVRSFLNVVSIYYRRYLGFFGLFTSGKLSNYMSKRILWSNKLLGFSVSIP